jgi:hypothetical protein
MAQAVELGLEQINANINDLPDASDADFGRAVGAVLSDLRKLEAVAANAARSARGAPEVAIVLSAVRKSYSDVMLRAARSPSATLGQQSVRRAALGRTEPRGDRQRRRRARRRDPRR